MFQEVYVKKKRSVREVIRKLGYIMLVIAMTLGQPLTVFANTVKDGSQNDSLENNLEMTDVSVAEESTTSYSSI